MGRGFDESFGHRGSTGGVACPCPHGVASLRTERPLCKDLLRHSLPTSQRRTDPYGSSATNPATSGMTPGTRGSLGKIPRRLRHRLLQM